MNNSNKRFEKLKKESSKILFSIVKNKKLKKDINDLKYNEINYKKLKFIVNNLKFLTNIEDYILIHDIIHKMLKSNNPNKFYKLLKCKNYLLNDTENLIIKKQILYSIDRDYLKKEIYENYLKLINNKIFLKSNDIENTIKNMILNIIYNMDNKESFENLYKISINRNFWEEYTQEEKYRIIEEFSKHLNCESITKFIYTLTIKLYFKEEYIDINRRILSAYMTLNEKNCKTLQHLIDNIDAKTFNENKQKLYDILYIIETATEQDSKKEIEYMLINNFETEFSNKSKNNKQYKKE